ncbi:hypothetical protein D3C72_2125890 [compost metagenome]
MPSALSASDLEKVSAFWTVLVKGSRASVMKPCNCPIASSARLRILSAVASRLVTLDWSASNTAGSPVAMAFSRMLASPALPPESSI